ncbi:hypothetical protein WA1_24075 [Scytonema hofmannii PCC 7110]|uniref:Uncharacterized protein n=1 Tax=Scytonema hofmannii PCC 7110 TaxID=128403 RepID=A0A139X7P0_9CYAN|nr:WD40 repeat domain-containing protein [Scytonema hofmannii]KYC40721.1 hypothetical protein WA1_24075 [Scytonema hofmannii PCC 7110]USN26961.1 hypothetical protein [synthetic construct]
MKNQLKKPAKTSASSQRVRLGALLPNLVKSNKPGHLEKYFQFLTNFHFLADKTHHPDYGIDELIRDYDLIHADPDAINNPEYDTEKVKALTLIQGALRLSAHVLCKDKTPLAGQLLGRLMLCEAPEIQVLLGMLKQQKDPWLRPLTPSLTPPGGRLIRTLTGHSSGVNALALTPDGKRVISASDDKTLKVWNLETGSLESTLTGHSSGVNALALTPDGKRVISASDDKTLKVWNLETGSLESTLTGHSDWVNALALTPDGKRVISASDDKTLKVWNLETGSLESTLTGHSDWVNALALTPDGKRVISASDDKTLKVWNLETGSLESTLTGHSDWVNALALTPDGKRVISASYDKTLKVWNLETGKGVFSLIKNLIARRQLLTLTLTGHSSWVNALALTPDGKRVISASDDKTLKVWNLETGSLESTLTGHSDWVNALALTPDGKRVISASYDKTLKVWNLETGSLESTLTGHSSRVNALVLTPDGKRVISASDDSTLKVWNLETREIIVTFAGDNSLFCCTVALDGLTIAVGDSLGRVHFLRMEGLS